jgi:hypothetical protein
MVKMPSIGDKFQPEIFSFDIVFSQSEGRADADRFIASARSNVKSANFFFCGPANSVKPC